MEQAEGSWAANFLYRAFPYLYILRFAQDRLYNTARPHQGRGMDQMTPWEKLHSLWPELQPGLAAFPPLLLDELSGQNPLPLSASQTVQHLPATYRKRAGTARVV